MRSAILAVALSIVAAVPVSAQVQRQAPDKLAPPPIAAFKLYKMQMLRLRDEARALQQADGGTLTPEHDADIQRRIDRTTALYHRRLDGQTF